RPGRLMSFAGRAKGAAEAAPFRWTWSALFADAGVLARLGQCRLGGADIAARHEQRHGLVVGARPARLGGRAMLEAGDDRVRLPVCLGRLEIVVVLLLVRGGMSCVDARRDRAFVGVEDILPLR